MAVHHLAGKPAPRELLANIPRLLLAYYAYRPDPSNPLHRVSFGTSGHRGTSLDHSFNEAHIIAITQAICEYRASEGIRGPLFIGMDTHALSEPAHATCLEVLAANDVVTRYHANLGYTPTPVISHAILTHNQSQNSSQADGIVITPSHNPPTDGGIKYNPPDGGPADTTTTTRIEQRANELLGSALGSVKRIAYEKALKQSCVQPYDFITPYVRDLQNVIDFDAIKQAELRIGVDPLGGSGIHFWDPIAERYELNIEVVNRAIDPTFSFMAVDKDGKIRMDCSSPYAMAGLIELKDRFDIAFGNDPDYDRHGIVTPSVGLMNPNHYLSVAIAYLFSHRSAWKPSAAIGKTLVSSSMIDRVAAGLGKKLSEVPVGFKWFVNGLLSGDYGFGGEESAGASFLRKDGTVWTTDKDGIILNLLAAEITAVMGKDPGEIYKEFEGKYGTAVYERMDAPATPQQKAALKKLSPDLVTAKELAGEPILAKLTKAPGNHAEIGGLKVVTENGWFAARPSGTENIYKIYAESFRGKQHLQQVQQEAKTIVDAAFKAAGVAGDS